MLEIMGLLFIMILVTVILGSIVPVIQYLIMRRRKGKTIYLFSIELFERKCPTSKLVERGTEEFEQKKREEYSTPLP